jgi:hypothetical protein
MNRTILALAIIGFTSATAAAQSIRLSEVPPGAIHTPGIGPGYIYPSYSDDASTMGASTMPATSMVPGMVYLPSEQVPATDTGEARALAILRQQGFTSIQGLRQAPDGSWHAMAMQRGGMMPVTVDSDGSVSVREQ